MHFDGSEIHLICYFWPQKMDINLILNWAYRTITSKKSTDVRCILFIISQLKTGESGISSGKISYIRGDACSINAVISDYYMSYSLQHALTRLHL